MAADTVSDEPPSLEGQRSAAPAEPIGDSAPADTPAIDPPPAEIAPLLQDRRRPPAKP